MSAGKHHSLVCSQSAPRWSVFEQSQVNPLPSRTQRPPCWHRFGEQGSGGGAVWQLGPVYPPTHWHLAAPSTTAQIPPKRQAKESQGSSEISQCAPSASSGQSQVYVPMPSTQVPNRQYVD